MNQKTLILIGVLAAAAGVAYYLYQKDQAEKAKANAPQPVVSPGNGNPANPNNKTVAVLGVITDTATVALDQLEKLRDTFGI